VPWIAIPSLIWNTVEMSNDKVEEMKSLVKYGKPVMFQSTAKFKGVTKKTNSNGILEVDENNTEDILNSILPPREYTKDKKQLYVETVLSTPATRLDVIQLEEVYLKGT